MKSSTVTVSEVQSALKALGHAQILELSAVSGVPFNTLWNIRRGITTNPGLATINRFMSFIPAKV